MAVPKHIWLLWWQGWEHAPPLQRWVARSWEVQNPGWTVERLDGPALRELVGDAVPYIWDTRKTISMPARSDIARLALLNKFGGVWADSTLLCMQPLEEWVNGALAAEGFWMYHGAGGGMHPSEGPCSWFMVSLQGAPLVATWKAACDGYWRDRGRCEGYFWMDALFRGLWHRDPAFKEAWRRVPYEQVGDWGSAHCMYGTWGGNDQVLKARLSTRPPHVVKLWNEWTQRWPGALPMDKDPAVENTNAWHAIVLALGGPYRAYKEMAAIADAMPPEDRVGVRGFHPTLARIRAFLDGPPAWLLPAVVLLVVVLVTGAWALLTRGKARRRRPQQQLLLQQDT